MFPNITFYIRYADEDMGYNVGQYSIKNSQVKKEDVEEGTDKSLQFACNVWDINYDEYICEE